MLYVAAPLNYKCTVFAVEGQIQYNDQMHLKKCNVFNIVAMRCSAVEQCELNSAKPCSALSPSLHSTLQYHLPPIQ
jgi:hypothetical protein